jgi:Secretion system C-terminal sorting domain
MVDFSRPGEGIDFFVMKYNAQHERLWTYNNPQSFSIENSYSGCTIDDGSIYIPYYRTDDTNTSRLLKLNSNGEVVSDIQILCRGIWQDCIVTSSGNLLLVGRNATGGQNRGALICSCNENGEYQWSQLQDGDDDLQYFFAGFKRVFQTEDGNYVVGGVLYERTDTPDPDDDPYNYVICFRKLTESGEMLWERRYQKVISFQDRHDLADMTITSDGGIVGVMVALDNNEEVPEVGHPQRAWILKLDECGCLVPGCDSSCPEVEESGSGSPYYFGPNPASNLFSVGSATMDKYSFSIYDDLGRLILEKQNAQKDMGYLVDVENWSSGMYFLHIQDQEGKGYVERVVVE